MAKTLAIANQKGGVGKTTTVINLAAGLSLNNKKVLVIDLDPQGNATTGLGLSNIDQTSNSIYQVLIGTKKIDEAISKTNFSNLDIITSNVDLSGLEVETATENRRAFLLKDKLENFISSENNDFSYVFIDCPPSLGLITLNCLTAADSVLIPIQCEYFALEGLGKLLSTIRKIQELHNSKLDVEGLLLTMYDSRLKLSNLVIEQVKLHFPEIVFNTIIQRNVRLSEATGNCKSIIKYDATSRGAINYLNLAKEFLEKNNPALIEKTEN